MENENNPVEQPVSKVPTRTPSAAAQPSGVQPEQAQPQSPYQQPCQPQAPSQSNGLGVAGFVVSLCGLVLCWVPFLDLVLGVTGLILSAFGMKRLPKGLATAGLVIGIIATVISIIMLILIIIEANAPRHSFYW